MFRGQHLLYGKHAHRQADGSKHERWFRHVAFDFVPTKRTRNRPLDRVTCISLCYARLNVHRLGSLRHRTIGGTRTLDAFDIITGSLWKYCGLPNKLQMNCDAHSRVITSFKTRMARRGHRCSNETRVTITTISCWTLKKRFEVRNAYSIWSFYFVVDLTKRRCLKSNPALWPLLVSLTPWHKRILHNIKIAFSARTRTHLTWWNDNLRA